MPNPSDIETAAVAYIIGQLKNINVEASREWTITVSREPVRFRQVDLRCRYRDREVWVDIDGPNHKGKRNILRDQQLMSLAAEAGARLIHWQLWRIVLEGAAPLLNAILETEYQHFGHADPRGYVAWRHSVYGKPPFTVS